MGANDQGADATQGRWVVIPRTLCVVRYGDDVLLLKRAAHKRVFPNKYNGVGGHIERHEDPQTSAIREIKEETGLDVYNIQLRGVINIDAGQSSGIMLFVYMAYAAGRDFTDSDEGTLEWVPIGQVYDKDLVEDFPYLLPRLLSDEERPFAAHVSYDESDTLVFRFMDDLT